MPSQTGIGVTCTLPPQFAIAVARQSWASVVEVTPMALTMTSQVPPIWNSVHSPVGCGDSQI